MIDVPYHPYYCEENSWLICRRLEEDGRDPSSLHMTFLFSRSRCIAMREQRSVPSDSIVCWDYHVCVIERAQYGARVWDPESRLASPIDLKSYIARSFLEHERPEGRALARIVLWTVARTEFGSDRRHMLSGAVYLHPPPSWPPVGCREHTLPFFLDPTDSRYGVPIDLGALRERFS